MRPAPKQKGLDYSVLNQKIGAKTHKALCSAVVYGPSASGKSNIIGAMDTFKAIVLRGNIRNGDTLNSPNAAAMKLELVPNKFNSENPPVEFSIVFIEEGLLVEYAFGADVGGFLDSKYVRKIVSEQLKINGKLIFLRTGELTFDSLQSIKSHLVNDFKKNEASAVSLAKSSLNDEELFLTNGFKTMFSTKLTALITEWLANKFMIVYRADSVYLASELTDPQKKLVWMENMLTEVAMQLGVTANALGYITSENESSSTLYSFFQEAGADRSIAIPADIFESYGTIRLVTLFPMVVHVILNGGILVVDEFDASIHPMVLMSIVNIFHNDEINVNKAQLIFNTHNPIFLNSNLFRRDEVKFTEKDDETQSSSHYSLSDFGTTGDKGVRKDEDYQRNYFISRYGAIRDIDFTPFFEDLLKNRKEGQI
jgi:AAA15 family ATPase/GTPase